MLAAALSHHAGNFTGKSSMPQCFRHNWKYFCWCSFFRLNSLTKWNGNSKAVLKLNCSNTGVGCAVAHDILRGRNIRVKLFHVCQHLLQVDFERRNLFDWNLKTFLLPIIQRSFFSGARQATLWLWAINGKIGKYSPRRQIKSWTDFYTNTTQKLNKFQALHLTTGKMMLLFSRCRAW